MNPAGLGCASTSPPSTAWNKGGGQVCVHGVGGTRESTPFTSIEGIGTASPEGIDLERCTHEMEA
jgi:hypothetical protein